MLFFFSGLWVYTFVILGDVVTENKKNFLLLLHIKKYYVSKERKILAYKELCNLPTNFLFWLTFLYVSSGINQLKVHHWGEQPYNRIIHTPFLLTKILRVAYNLCVSFWAFNFRFNRNNRWDNLSITTVFWVLVFQRCRNRN